MFPALNSGHSTGKSTGSCAHWRRRIILTWREWWYQEWDTMHLLTKREKGNYKGESIARKKNGRWVWPCNRRVTTVNWVEALRQTNLDCDPGRMTLDKLHHLHVPQLYHFENGHGNVHSVLWDCAYNAFTWCLVHSKDLSILAVYT